MSKPLISTKIYTFLGEYYTCTNLYDSLNMAGDILNRLENVIV